MRDIVSFMRKNPQVFILLVICIVLGLGTFLAVVFGLISAGGGNYSGEPSGALPSLHAALPSLHAALRSAQLHAALTPVHAAVAPLSGL